MSTVYLARDEVLDRPVAVKLMHREMTEQPDQLERFNQEARAVAKLSNPNVVAVIDAGEDRAGPYIVLEYVRGETPNSGSPGSVPSTPPRRWPTGWRLPRASASPTSATWSTATSSRRMS